MDMIVNVSEIIMSSDWMLFHSDGLTRTLKKSLSKFLVNFVILDKIKKVSSKFLPANKSSKISNTLSLWMSRSSQT